MMIIYSVTVETPDLNSHISKLQCSHKHKQTVS